MVMVSNDPPMLSPAALTELKAQIGITLSEEDALLFAALRSAFTLCELFTGQILLRRAFREVQPVSNVWKSLSARPVVQIESVTGLDSAGGRFALEIDAYAVDLDGMGQGRVRIYRPGSAGRIEIGYMAGMVGHWGDLPEPIRQGILHLAAYSFQNRHIAASLDPPAAIGALWRPWRWMRLA